MALLLPTKCNILNDMKQIAILLSAVLCVSACVSFGAATPDAEVQTFLPGECLKSTELTYGVPHYSTQMCVNGKYRFIFPLDLDFSNECMDHTVIKNRWRHVTTQEMYDAFGENGKLVKKAYEDEFESFLKLYQAKKHPGAADRFSIVTILYNGGISLVADKDFAGVPAGKDLSDIIGPDPYLWNSDLFPDIPLEYITMPGESIAFSVPLGDFNVVQEPVNFELNIPVKVVMYLQWLNDKLTDPDAPVPYKEEVLHCSFTSPYCLK